jgi:hypothetical protein
MTTFFTVLILSYAVQGQELQMRMVYETEAECSEMIMRAEALVANPLAVTCARSNLISWAKPPMERPDDLLR